MSVRPARLVLSAALLALAALYATLYHDDPRRIAAWAVFVLPPLWLALTAPRGRQAPFWAGVLALFWFSHGVMAAWTEPAQRLLHVLEIGLALLVIGAASVPGLRARRQARRAQR